MALFGDLKHHMLADLAKVLQTRTGTLLFHSSYQGRTLELSLKEGSLRAMYLDGFPIKEPAQVNDILHQLYAQGQGAFEFHKQSALAGDSSFYDLMFADLVSEIVDSDVPELQLPHPDTRFVRTLKSAQVPYALLPVWTAIRPDLTAGSSAAALARHLGLPERDVLVALYRLRALDLVTPLRAAALPEMLPLPVAAPSQLVSHRAPHASPAHRPPAAAPVPLVQRLLGALRRLTKGSLA